MIFQRINAVECGCVHMYTCIKHHIVRVQCINNTQNAAVAPRPSTTHPLVWAEQHKHTISIQLTCARLTSLTHPFTILPINPSNFPKIPSWRVRMGLLSTLNITLDFCSSDMSMIYALTRASRDSKCSSHSSFPKTNEDLSKLLIASKRA